MITLSASFLRGKPLAEGGEALVYEYNDKIVKIFKPNVNKAQKKKKIEKLLSASLPKGVIGPIDMVQNEKGTFIGYVMSRVEGEELKKLCSKKYLKLNGITIKHVCKMLYQIQETLKVLHTNNIVVGDLNECNILFDKSYNVYMIDVDSWSVGGEKCTVAMESFQDPKMSGTDFTPSTDWYAFAIMVFKELTMLHPFGGNTDPEIPILDRMKKGLSVIDNNRVIIPKALCKDWSFMSPELLADLKKIFDKGERFCIDKSFTDFAKNLTQCTQHKDFYYSKYNKCPVCHDDAEILEDKPTILPPTATPAPPPKRRPGRPKKVSVTTGIACSALYTSSDIKVMLDENVYVDQNNVVHFREVNTTYSYNSDARYYQYKDTTVVGNKTEFAISDGSNVYKFDKLRGSRVQVRGESIFYINTNNTLTELQYSKNGNTMRSIQHVAFKNYFEVYDKDHYMTYNIYDGVKIVCVDGYNHELKVDYQVANYGMHYDPITGCWLLIVEDESGKFHTNVFKKDKIIYENESIKLSCDLGDLCHYNGVLYIPKDDAIRGFNYLKNVYKDFECSAVTSDCKLIKTGPKFTIIRENGLFEIG